MQIYAIRIPHKVIKMLWRLNASKLQIVLSIINNCMNTGENISHRSTDDTAFKRPESDLIRRSPKKVKLSKHLSKQSVTGIKLNLMSCKNEMHTHNCVLEWEGMKLKVFDIHLFNRMFIVYNELTNCVITDEAVHHTIYNVSIIPTCDNRIIFLAPDGSVYKFRMDSKIEENNTVECLTSFRNKYLIKIQCYDMGEEAAKWISKFLKRSELRLACRKLKLHPIRDFHTLYENKYAEVTEERYIMFDYDDVPDFSIMFLGSVDEVFQKVVVQEELNYHLANIILDSKIPFIEDEYQMFQICAAVIKNIITYPRSITLMPPGHIPVDMRKRMLLQHGNVLHAAYIYIKRNPMRRTYFGFDHSICQF